MTVNPLFTARPKISIMIAKDSTSMLVKLADFFISGDKHTSCCSWLFLSSSGCSGAAGLVTACGSLEGFWRLILALSSLSLIGKVGTLFHLSRCSLGTLGRSFSPKNVLLGMVQTTPPTIHPACTPFWQFVPLFAETMFFAALYVGNWMKMIILNVESGYWS